MGSKKDAPIEAAAIQNEATQAGIDETRRQFEVTQANLDPFIGAGTDALGRVTGASTLEGFGANIDAILSGGVLDPLVDERTQAINSQLSASGLQRSGTSVEQAAAIPTELAFALEETLAGRSSNLAGMGLGAATGAGQLGAQASQSIAQQLGAQGEASANAILGQAQAEAAGVSQAISTIATGAMLFSDPRLKENTMKIGDIDNLSLYQWDWIPEAKGTIIEKYPTIGFMADEVERKYPNFVGVYAGWKVIRYGKLLDHIESKIKQPEPAFA